MCVCVYRGIYIYIYMCVWVCVYVYVCVDVCICVCGCVYVYICVKFFPVHVLINLFYLHMEFVITFFNYAIYLIA